MRVNELKIACFSDVHLGHKKTSTQEILDSLSRMFPDDGETAQLDIIFIAGDFFDRLLILPDPNVIKIKKWIGWFLKLCKKHNIALRVLEGTPSHDWKQSILFTTINDLSSIGCDVKYFDILDIEFFDKFGINVVYIPDEWNTDNLVTYQEVLTLLGKHSLKKADLIVMHGAFEYQLPSNVKVPTHSSEKYQELVNHFILVGHIHRHTMVGKIIAQGSFNRLSHGEEEDKGHIRIILKKNNQHEVMFIPTLCCKTYKTIDCRDKTVDECLTIIKKVIDPLPKDSHFRILAEKDNPIFASIAELQSLYPFHHITVKATDAKKITDQALLDMVDSYRPISITPENIEELLLARIKNKIDPVLFNKAKEVLHDTVHEKSG